VGPDGGLPDDEGVGYLAVGRDRLKRCRPVARPANTPPDGKKRPGWQGAAAGVGFGPTARSAKGHHAGPGPGSPRRAAVAPCPRSRAVSLRPYADSPVEFERGCSS